MKIGVLSDSHGNRDYLRKATDILLKAEKVDLLIHLGDNYEDTFLFERLNVNYLRVPGVFSTYYQNPFIPNRLIKEFSGKKILITHCSERHENDPQGELSPQEIISKEKIDILLYGHTHIPKIEKKGCLWVNPGHLKEQDKKGYPASFAILDFKKGLARIVDLIKKRGLFRRSF